MYILELHYVGKQISHVGFGQSSTCSGCKFCIFRYMEINIIKLMQSVEYGMCLRDAGQIACQDYIPCIVYPGCKYSQHAYGLEYQIDYAQGCIGLGGQIADPAEV